jgi:hypothetical protein
VSIGPRRRRTVLLAPFLAGLVACGANTTTGRGSPDPAQLPAQASGLPVPGETAPSAAPSPSVVPTTKPPAARPCPVAATLPDGRNAVLVAGYETKRFRVYYCRTTTGALYYHGASKTAATQTVTIPATPIPGGYEAHRTVDGHTFVYRVAANTLTVLRDGRTILTDPVLHHLFTRSGDLNHLGRIGLVTGPATAP